MRGNELSIEPSRGNEFPNKVAVNVYMLCPFMGHWILTQEKCTFVVTGEEDGKRVKHATLEVNE